MKASSHAFTFRTLNRFMKLLKAIHLITSNLLEFQKISVKKQIRKPPRRGEVYRDLL